MHYSYKPNDIIYLDTGDYEFVLIIERIEGTDYIIRNGVFRFKDSFTPPDTEFQIDEPTMDAPIIVTDFKLEEDLDFPLIFPPNIRVPEWAPVHTIYPFYEDKSKFDREPLDEITRMASEDEAVTVMKMVGFDISWRENLGI